MPEVKSVTPELLRDLAGKLQELPEDHLREVLDFVDFLRSHQLQQSKRGSPEALLQHVGTWSFAPGELDHLLADIQETREMELDR
ncbi:MAG: DUF2281 domain-containing protein [Chloroflexota bacterium]|nr:DUF2281 domain-containing protein [Chloroflexota bacterium]